MNDARPPTLTQIRTQAHIHMVIKASNTHTHRYTNTHTHGDEKQIPTHAIHPIIPYFICDSAVLSEHSGVKYVQGLLFQNSPDLCMYEGFPVLGVAIIGESQA